MAGIGLITLSIIYFLFILLYNIKLQLEIHELEKTNLQKENKNNFKTVFRIILFNKIVIFSKKIEHISKAKGINKLIKGKGTKIEIIDLIKLLINQVRVKEFKLNLQIGIDDVLVTTYLVPIISTIVSTILAKANKEKKNKIKYTISPIYNRNAYKVQFNCILNVKLVHIIYIIYTHRKGEMKNGRTTSNRRAYENSYG